MIWLTPTCLPIKTLGLPGDVKSRMKLPHVIELAESIRERTGNRPIHLPTIEYPSKELLAGGDRIAACLINGDAKVWVQPVSQLTDQERRDIVRDENLHRRADDRDALIRQRVAEREEEIQAQRIEAGPDVRDDDGFLIRKPGRKKTAKGEAREEVARELGTTPGAVRAAEARASAPHVHFWTAVEDDGDGVTEACSCGETRGGDGPVPGPPPPVDTYGLPLLTDVVETAQVILQQEIIAHADAALRRAQAELGKLANLPMVRGAQQLIAQVHEVAAAVRRARWSAVCPYCKRLPHFVIGCKPCGTSGFVGADDMLGVADELKLGGEQAMVVALGGRMVKYAFALTGKAAKGSTGAALESGAGKSASATPRSESGRPASVGSAPRAIHDCDGTKKDHARAVAMETKAAAKKIRIEDEAGKPIAVADDEITDEDIPF